MNYSLKEAISQNFNFGKINGREIIANFQGGKITSDAGIILIAELDKKLKITERFANCFQDYRHAIEDCRLEILDWLLPKGRSLKIEDWRFEINDCLIDWLKDYLLPEGEEAW